MDTVVFITSVQPELLIWIGAISFFVSLAATAVVSPGRQWFELVVIFGLCFGFNVLIVGAGVHLVTDVDVIAVEAVHALDHGRLTD